MTIKRTTGIEFVSVSFGAFTAPITVDIDELYKLPGVKEVLGAGMRYQQLVLDDNKSIDVTYNTVDENIYVFCKNEEDALECAISSYNKAAE